MKSKLNLNPALIQQARASAEAIAQEVQGFIDDHTTVTVERTIARLMGIDGIDEVDQPLPNVVVNHIREGGGLETGVAYWLGNAMVATGKSPQEIAEGVSDGSLNLLEIPAQNRSEVEAVVGRVAGDMVTRIRQNRQTRDQMLTELGEGPKPYLYLIVASGNIYEDVVQAQAAVRQGADIIAVIRSTAQSLLDYVPYGPTTEGFGGTYATQENFRIMRKALDETGEQVGRYIRLCNYCSGLCMPEIAAMGAIERLDVMLNDALYGILFRDINMQRTLVDQFFSRVINGFAGIIINTGEDNYLTTADAVEEAHTVVASQFINEQFALKAGLPEEQMALGHAFEMDPDIPNGFLLELAQAQMAREIFPKAPLKYMPPTKFMTGNIFKGHIQDAMFNLASIWTHQGIQLLGMLTEANHTPHLHDRALAIENAKYIFNNCRDIGEEVEFKEGGMIQRRAQQVLADAVALLTQIESDGLYKTIEEGKFGGVKRSRTGGKGLKGVFRKGAGYMNPFIALMLGGER
ncbi:lysine 5,6-aminomutase subunit alpha [Anoxynatronum buryatiense]|uniref:Beta-lysine 5,6-aminomutase alpha subunit /D-lysine 5,6-aminomutase alpha subunit n=1 Tax=Anoxynatronum buryatiense TaxID=489973 RepID=A0AA45WYT1_9CLOT|nr:lysine 5,6-aminomutase subunit alpha [Anoxynatronum buryatiense]SMP70390.1 beta-lysine 5,6-aminomutase alpha subunit /D-lysine 5,6-aminomutase alpha subunit [Anoxynatronum buryatiense]